MRTAILVPFVALCALCLPNLAEGALERATVKGGKVYLLEGDKLTPVIKNLKFPSEIEITTNATFRVASGEFRKIREGQIIRSDGWLLNPDGAIEPVFDHVGMKEGKVILVKDGQVQAVTATMRLPSNLQLNPNGDCIFPSGNRSRLVDGQMFRLDGSAIPSKDTVTLKNGTVVVQKDGRMISIRSPQIMGLNDGSRVHGDGTISHRDGRVTKLAEGETVFVDGRRTNH